METRRVSEGYSRRRFIPPDASGYLLSGTHIFNLDEGLVLAQPADEQVQKRANVGDNSC